MIFQNTVLDEDGHSAQIETVFGGLPFADLIFRAVHTQHGFVGRWSFAPGAAFFTRGSVDQLSVEMCHLDDAVDYR